ncbi:betaine/proline/choline family ABC transporter ATP-binding protein [Megamonas funiformis]|uniref:betaine/proline/choline family ABC transporter ATP-binding protein n=1 Tax=Megamonas funiformis TaxID=437897 RepID=UPI00195A62DD|nr:ABC transporter ATP-binding protein [Megamonas funiformis]
MITFEEVDKAYKEKLVLHKINFTINDGEFVVLIGSSGCGKTTLLKTINKLETVDRGLIKIDNVSIRQQNTLELRRRIGYVVQDAGLFPHMTIYDNIATVLKISNYDNNNIENRVDELLEMVDLEPNSYKYLYPCQLSGGQKQRVGVARAFATNPDIILMDEPFSALDPVTRSDLQEAVVKLQKQFKKTIVFVTHDMDEAIKLADKICIIQKGWIVQYDTPENILKNPANEYVQNFVGKNRLWSNPEFIKASDIMLKNPCKISVDRIIIQALQVMNHAHVDSVLVTEDNKFLGIVWLADLQNFDSYSGSLKNFISDDYHVVYENTSLKEITNAVDYIHFGIVPVLDLKNELVGYLTKSRLLSVLSRQYQDSVRQKDGILA